MSGYPPHQAGESAPRRATPEEPVDTAAANAEAARIARDLGVASSVRPQTSKWSFPLRSNKSSTPASPYVRMKDDDSTSSSRVSAIPVATLEVGPTYSHFEDTHEPIHLFDSHGQRAPYKEGPYFIAREKDGTVVKKRWCTLCLLCKQVGKNDDIGTRVDHCN